MGAMLNRFRQKGQTMSEYVIVMLFLAVALFVPWRENEPSVVALFLEAVRTYHTQASFPLSLP